MRIGSLADAEAGVRRMRVGTVSAAAAFAALAAAVIAGAQAFPAPVTPGAPGAARLPIIYACALLALSAALAAMVLLERNGAALEFRRAGRVAVFAALTAVFVGLLPVAGFMALAIPWLLVAVRTAGGGWIGAAATAILLPLGIQLSFVAMLGVPLP